MIRVDGSEVTVLAVKYRTTADQMSKIIYPEMKQLGSALMTYMRQELRAVKYTGALERSVSADISLSGRESRLSVGPVAPHTPYVRMGTKAHWVPIEPLKRWAAYKLGDEKAAYAVRWAIHQRGTSAWAEKLYGSKSNPYPMRVMRRGDTKRSVQAFGLRVMKRVVQELGKK